MAGDRQYDRELKTRQTYIRWSKLGLVDGLFWFVVAVVLGVFSIFSYYYIVNPYMGVEVSFLPRRAPSVGGLGVPAIVATVLLPTISRYRRKNLHRLPPIAAAEESPKETSP